VGFLGAIVASLQLLTSPYATSPLWLSDVNEEVLTRCRGNIQLPCSTFSLICSAHAMASRLTSYIDLSSSHPNVHYRLLDWSHALDCVTLPRIQSFLQEVDAELILGADIVCASVLGLSAPIIIENRYSTRKSHRPWWPSFVWHYRAGITPGGRKLSLR
jgi:hypothetical protein